MILTVLGKRIVQLQASLALVQNPNTSSMTATTDEFGRTPFTHPALDGLKNLSSNAKSSLTDRTKLAELAQRYKMLEVLRWAPKTVGFLGPRWITWLLTASIARQPSRIRSRAGSRAHPLRDHWSSCVGEGRKGCEPDDTGADSRATWILGIPA